MMPMITMTVMVNMMIMTMVIMTTAIANMIVMPTTVILTPVILILQPLRSAHDYKVRGEGDEGQQKGTNFPRCFHSSTTYTCMSEL